MIESLMLYNLNNLIEIMSFALTLLVGVYGLKIYKLTGENKHKLFSMTFIILSLAILTKAGANILTNNLLIYSSPLSIIGNNIYLSLSILSYSLLVSLTLKIRDIQKFSLLILITVLTILCSNYISFHIFELVSFWMLIYPVYYFFTNYLKNESLPSFLVFLSFFTLMLSHLMFIPGILNETFFILDNIGRIVSYTTLLIYMILIKK